MPMRSVATRGLRAMMPRAWLPFMGKPFAQAGRQLRRLNKKPSDANLKLAISCMHHAINETAASSVFSDTTDALLKKAPSFTSIQTEFKQFFALSNQVFFDGQQAEKPAQSMQWLKTFCKQCRDCERGLKPAKNKAKA